MIFISHEFVYFKKPGTIFVAILWRLQQQFWKKFSPGLHLNFITMFPVHII